MLPSGLANVTLKSMPVFSSHLPSMKPIVLASEHYNLVVKMLQANIPLLPDARPDDGLLDVVVIAPRRVTQWPIVVWRLMTRTNRTDMYLERFTGRKVEIHAAVDVQRQLDGDPIGPGRSLSTEIEPGALTARVPKRR